MKYSLRPVVSRLHLAMPNSCCQPWALPSSQPAASARITAPARMYCDVRIIVDSPLVSGRFHVPGQCVSPQELRDESDALVGAVDLRVLFGAVVPAEGLAGKEPAESQVHAEPPYPEQLANPHDEVHLAADVPAAYRDHYRLGTPIRGRQDDVDLVHLRGDRAGDLLRDLGQVVTVIHDIDRNGRRGIGADADRTDLEVGQLRVEDLAVVLELRDAGESRLVRFQAGLEERAVFRGVGVDVVAAAVRIPQREIRVQRDTREAIGEADVVAD